MGEHRWAGQAGAVAVSGRRLRRCSGSARPQAVGHCDTGRVPRDWTAPDDERSWPEASREPRQRGRSDRWALAHPGFGALIYASIWLAGWLVIGLSTGASVADAFARALGGAAFFWALSFVGLLIRRRRAREPARRPLN